MPAEDSQAQKAKPGLPFESQVETAKSEAVSEMCLPGRSAGWLQLCRQKFPC